MSAKWARGKERVLTNIAHDEYDALFPHGTQPFCEEGRLHTRSRSNNIPKTPSPPKRRGSVRASRSMAKEWDIHGRVVGQCASLIKTWKQQNNKIPRNIKTPEAPKRRRTINSIHPDVSAQLSQELRCFTPDRAQWLVDSLGLSTQDENTHRSLNAVDIGRHEGKRAPVHDGCRAKKTRHSLSAADPEPTGSAVPSDGLQQTSARVSAPDETRSTNASSGGERRPSHSVRPLQKALGRKSAHAARRKSMKTPVSGASQAKRVGRSSLRDEAAGRRLTSTTLPPEKADPEPPLATGPPRASLEGRPESRRESRREQSRRRAAHTARQTSGREQPAADEHGSAQRSKATVNHVSFSGGDEAPQAAKLPGLNEKVDEPAELNSGEDGGGPRASEAQPRPNESTPPSPEPHGSNEENSHAQGGRAMPVHEKSTPQGEATTGERSCGKTPAPRHTHFVAAEMPEGCDNGSAWEGLASPSCWGTSSKHFAASFLSDQMGGDAQASSLNAIALDWLLKPPSSAPVVGRGSPRTSKVGFGHAGLAWSKRKDVPLSAPPLASASSDAMSKVVSSSSTPGVAFNVPQLAPCLSWVSKRGSSNPDRSVSVTVHFPIHETTSASATQIRSSVDTTTEPEHIDPVAAAGNSTSPHTRSHQQAEFAAIPYRHTGSVCGLSDRKFPPGLRTEADAGGALTLGLPKRRGAVPRGATPDPSPTPRGHCPEPAAAIKATAIAKVDPRSLEPSEPKVRSMHGVNSLCPTRRRISRFASSAKQPGAACEPLGRGGLARPRGAGGQVESCRYTAGCFRGLATSEASRARRLFAGPLQHTLSRSHPELLLKMHHPTATSQAELLLKMDHPTTSQATSRPRSRYASSRSNLFPASPGAAPRPSQMQPVAHSGLDENEPRLEPRSPRLSSKAKVKTSRQAAPLALLKGLFPASEMQPMAHSGLDENEPRLEPRSPRLSSKAKAKTSRQADHLALPKGVNWPLFQHDHRGFRPILRPRPLGHVADSSAPRKTQSRQSTAPNPYVTRSLEHSSPVQFSQTFREIIPPFKSMEMTHGSLKGLQGKQLRRCFPPKAVAEPIRGDDSALTHYAPRQDMSRSKFLVHSATFVTNYVICDR
ncbi:hypothetical protein CYMTET_21198 [Cymbomonas tetramitiformis]|uniref:Uncharacterized protein n=1 Tax=Cymbomonas tetramitiformis TaxID=36881 RepID=A0AAE0G2K7_9CHLO|nr:hypothetical protein CYMTET_21198 [Cymbomonas tetramitiformis]